MKNFVNICSKDSRFNLEFIQADYFHPDGGNTWYHIPLVVKDIGTIVYSEDLVKPTMEKIHKIIKEKNINVLLGFSQGGNVVDVYCKYFNNDGLIKKAVIMSSYSLCNVQEPHISDVHVLNIVSKSDEVVPWNLYPKSYQNSFLIEHEKGHKIPGNPILRKIKEFIEFEKI
jgi:predicted esterase